VLTSSNYAFFQLLAVLFVAVSGFTGLYYVLRGLTWVDTKQTLARGFVGNALLKVWVILFAFVGAQMTWRLSPFIGDPREPFYLIRPSRDNFFVDVINAFQSALGIQGASSGVDIAIVVLFGELIVIGLAISIWLSSRKKKADKRTADQTA
jgi:hypothetical protein